MDNTVNNGTDLAAPPARRSHGKICRLPFDVRTSINEAIRDGVAYAEIIARLQAKGISGVTTQNLSYWYQTGYQHWLAQVEQLDSMRLESELAVSMAGELDSTQKNSFNDFGKVLVDAQIMRALQHFDPQRLTELLADQPQKYFDLANILTDRSRERLRGDKLELELQKYRDLVAEQKRQLEEAIKPTPTGLTPETIEKIRKAINLM